MQFSPGDIVNDRFVVIKFLAGGGFGHVYHLFDLDSRTNMAGKMLPPTEFDFTELITEFFAYKELDHPSIVKTLGVFPAKGDNGCDFVALELVEGQNLDDAIYSAKPPPGRTKLDILRTIAEGLKHAHERGLIHGDLTTNNIVLDRDRKAKIVDLGLAKIAMKIASDYKLKRPSLFDDVAEALTLGYAAPESLSGAISPASDVYSFGILFFEMFNKRLPIMNLPAQLFQDSGRIFSVATVALMDKVYARCIAVDPLHRYQNGGELLVDVNAFCKHYDNERDSGYYLKESDFYSDKARFLMGECSSFEEMVKSLVRKLNGADPDDDWFRIDGQTEAAGQSNTEPYITFPLETGSELLRFTLNGDTKIQALRDFTRDCRKHSHFGLMFPDKFLMVEDLPDGNRALRLKSNWDESEKRFRARGFYCYVTD